MNTIVNGVGYDPVLFAPTDTLNKRNERVAEEVEALFLTQLLKEMDRTVAREEHDLLYGRGEAVMRSLFNQELARELARSDAGLGLKAMIQAEIERQEAVPTPVR